MKTTSGRAVALSLELCRQAKVSELLGLPANERFEASGVVAVDGALYVIFDNRSEIGRFGHELSAGGENRLIRQPFAGDTGYEDIARERSTGRFFILIESLPHDGGFYAKVREYDGSFSHVASAWLDYRLPGPNKGLEGLTCVERDGRTYLLGLCEGNRNRDGAAGRRPGGGRIPVFVRDGHGFAHVDTIRLPSSLPFEDYSSIAVAGERVCVASQASAAVWVGTLAASEWKVSDEGAVYGLPRDDRGHNVYCNVEGVSWLSETHVVVVSDKAKPDQKSRCHARDQSIHVFALPAA